MACDNSQRKVEDVGIGHCLTGRCERHSCQRHDDEELASTHAVFYLRDQGAVIYS